MSTMLSNQNFVFGEILSSAAQNPDVQDMDFGNLGFDAIARMGIDLSSYTFVKNQFDWDLPTMLS